MGQGKAIVALAPDAAAAILRKGVQTAISECSHERGDWSRKLNAMSSQGVITRFGEKAARRVVLIGDWAIHVPAGIDRSGAETALQFASYFLKSLGFDVTAYASEGDLRGVPTYLGYVTDGNWKGPNRFDSTDTIGCWNQLWYEGGMLDLLFRCLRCGAEILAEDLEVPPPNLVADCQSESFTYGATSTQCPVCCSDYDIEATNSMGGWDVDLRPIGEDSPTRPGEPTRSMGPVPEPWHYSYRVVLDYGEEPDEVDIPLEHTP